MATELRYNVRFTLNEKRAVESLLNTAIDEKAGSDPAEYKTVYNAWTRVCNAKPDYLPRKSKTVYSNHPSIKGLRR